VVNKIALCFVVFFSYSSLNALIFDDDLNAQQLQEKLLTSKGDPRLLFELRKSLTDFMINSKLDNNKRFLFGKALSEINNNNLNIKKNINILDREFNIINNLLDIKIGDNSAAFKEEEIDASYNKIISILGRETFSDILLTSKILEFKTLRIQKKDFEAEITREINRFEKSNWKDSPFLYKLYYDRCLNSKFKNKYSLLIKDSKILKSKYDLIFGESDDTYFVYVSFLISGLSGEGRHLECLELFKSAPKNMLDSDNISMQGPRCRIYEAVANSYWKTGKKQTALAYQEMAATIALSRFSNTENFIAKEQANILREMYAQMGDWKSLRNMEDRFKLKPLPQNSAEK